MKKFISFVMAAAMVASLVPATAFAATGDVSATAKIVGAWTKNQDAMDAVDGVVEGTNTPELQLKITNADYPQTTSKTPVQTVTVTLDNAEFADRNTLNNGISVNLASSGSNSAATTAYSYTALTAAQLKEFIIDYGYDGDTTIPSNYRKIDSYDSSGTSQQGDTLSGTDLSILTAPTTTGASLADNRTTALNAYLTSLSLDSYASGYVYSDNNVLYGEAGWLNIASSTKPFVSLAEVTEYAETNNTQDSDSNNIVVGGEIVSTLVKQDVDAWYTQESAESDFQELAAKLYVETSKYVPGTGTGRTVTAEIEAGDWSDDEITITITGWLAEDDVIAMDLLSTMDKTSKNATVSVESDMVDADDLTYVAIEDTGFTASVKKTISIAEEEVAYLNSNGLKLEEIVEGSFQKGDEVTLKLSKGFEFVSTDVYVNGIAATDEEFDDNELTFTLTQAMLDAGIDSDDIVTLTIKSTSDTASTDHGLKIEATSASAGTTGTITVTVGSMDKVTVDVAEVVAYEVVMSVDEDEDVPVIYSGVDADNTGITDDSDHETLEITLEESFPGAWSSRQGFTITIPEGVYVTDVEIVDQENFWQDDATMTDADWEDAFEDAYQDGDHLNFEFDKRVFDDVNASLNDDPASLTFVLTLVADPGFEGDVEIGFEGSLVESQSVVAATFVSPYIL